MKLVQMSLTASILIVGIVLLRLLFVHRLPKKAMVILWEIVILRLLLPFSLPLPLPGIGSLGAACLKEKDSAVEVTIDRVYEMPLEDGTGESAVIMSIVTAQKDEGHLLLIFYCIGAALMAAGSVYLYFRDSQLFREGLPMPDKEKRLILSAMDEKDKRRMEKVKFQISDRTATPVTYGIFCPAVVFPKGIYLKGKNEINFCLQHELVHIRNHDNIKKLIAHGVLCIYWFNPLVWVMYLLYNRDMELLCDETVVRRGKDSRQDYAMALLSMAQRHQAGFCTGLGFGKNAVKERITAVMKFKKMSAAKAFAAGVAVTAALTVFITGTAAYAEDTAQVQEYTVIVARENEALSGDLHITSDTDAAEDGRMDITWVEQYSEAVSEVSANAYDGEMTAAGGMSASADDSEMAMSGEASVSTYDETSAEGTLYDGMESIIGEYQQFGLSVVVSKEDYQLYYEGEPIYFFADNKKKDNMGFSGRLFLRPASMENGYTGVVTEYDDEGRITGVRQLSPKESAAYTKRWQ